LFGGFQSIAEIQELVLHRAAVHVVDGPAHVANQSFEFEVVHGDDFDVRTRLAGLQGKCDSFERISVSKKKRSFFRGELNPDCLALHQARLPALATWRCDDGADDDAVCYAASEVAVTLSR
jgi:hypothetical protein